MQHSLQHLVAESRQGDRKLLNEVCSSSPDIVDQIIDEIWSVFRFFAFKDKVNETPEPLPSYLVLRNDEYYFVESQTGTSYSKLVLEKHLLSIIRPLFQVHEEDELKRKPWVQEGPKSMMRCLYLGSSDFSAVLHALCGLKKLPYHHKVRDQYASEFAVALRAHFEEVDKRDDLDKINIVCEFIVLLYDSLLHGNLPFSAVDRLLVVKTAEKTSCRWPYQKTLNRVMQRYHVVHFMGSEAREISDVICDQLSLKYEEFGREHLEFLLFQFEHCGVAVEQGFIWTNPIIFTNVSSSLIDEFPEEFLTLFFHYYAEFTSIPEEHLEFLRKLNLTTRHSPDKDLRDPTALVLFALTHFDENRYPLRFLKSTIKLYMKTIDLKQIISHERFPLFVKEFILCPMREDAYLTQFGPLIDNILSRNVMKELVQTGVLHCLKIHQKIIAFDASVLVLNGLEYEEDLPVIHHAIMHNIGHTAFNVWRYESAKGFFLKRINKLETDTVTRILTYCNHSPNFKKNLPILMRMVDENMVMAILGNQLSVPHEHSKRDDWLQIQPEGSLNIRIERQLITHSLDFKDALRYVLEEGSSKSQIYKLIAWERILTNRLGSGGGKYTENYKFHSPFEDYMSTLANSHIPSLNSHKTVMQREFLMHPLPCVSEEFADFPISAFSCRPEILAEFLNFFVENPWKGINKRWAEEIVTLADKLFSKI